MTNADVTKLKCEFVRAIKLYLTQEKYLASPCMDNIRYYYSKYKLATTLVDCLTYEDECDLSTIASTIIEEPTITPTITECGDSLVVTLSQSTQNCSYTTTLTKLNGIASTFPELVLEDNEIYQPAYLQVKAVGCSQTLTTNVETGCLNISNGSPASCEETFKAYIDINFTLTGLQAHTTGYIKTLRVYQTDSNGQLINTPIDLNLAPSNIAAWVGCGLCSGVNPAHLYFGHANWATAFKTLLDNVAYTMFSNLDAFFTASKQSYGIILSNRVKHNPTSEWLGINKNDFKVVWVNDLAAEVTNTSPSITYSGTNNYMADDFSISTTCGSLTGRVVAQGSASGFGNSNFNYLDVTNPVLNGAATIVNLDSPTCTVTTLTASYTPVDTILNVGWYDGTDTLISSNDSTTVTTAGDYSFVVEFESGCTVTETITVT